MTTPSLLPVEAQTKDIHRPDPSSEPKRKAASSQTFATVMEKTARPGSARRPDASPARSSFAAAESRRPIGAPSTKEARSSADSRQRHSPEAATDGAPPPSQTSAGTAPGASDGADDAALEEAGSSDAATGSTPDSETVTTQNIIILQVPTIVPLPTAPELTRVSSANGIVTSAPGESFRDLVTESGLMSNVGSVTALDTAKALSEPTISGVPTAPHIVSLDFEPLTERERLAIQLREAIAQLDELEDRESESPGKIIPFPRQPASDQRIIPVNFGSNPPSTGDPSAPEAESLLPTPEPKEAKSAEADARPSPSSQTIVSLKTEAKTPALPHLRQHQPIANSSGADGGTPAARKEVSMDLQSPYPATGPVEGQSDGSLAGTPGGNAEPMRPEGASRNATGAEWPAAAGLNASSRSAPGEAGVVRPADTSATVEKVASLIGRESMLFRQASSESMAVVLRPDANTELFLHLTNRNGQLEASIRCERGDFQHLNSLWGQLQESLALQKVRLTPLEESSAGSDGSQFRNPGGFQQQQGRNESSRDPRPGNESMDEWPAPASHETSPAHVRSRRESGQRLTTSRPGWETWA